ncbi:uncharacterized protein LOC121988601 isoform X6 [Zingiber officinale]|uniref:uncharacterized protein LOC121988601 isoform X6 n=1 Tax=Zingiber officinale TaxID=94328 RepID=UPI001C4D5417|nr:uncharacterized protein LOC121988601 isoform X6 [Zingiber officinale]
MKHQTVHALTDLKSQRILSHLQQPNLLPRLSTKSAAVVRKMMMIALKKVQMMNVQNSNKLRRILFHLQKPNLLLRLSKQRAAAVRKMMRMIALKKVHMMNLQNSNKLRRRLKHLQRAIALTHMRNILMRKVKMRSHLRFRRRAEFFKAAGEVDVCLATSEDGSFKGFGHVEFATEENAKMALELNGNDYLVVVLDLMWPVKEVPIPLRVGCTSILFLLQ